MNYVYRKQTTIETVQFKNYNLTKIKRDVKVVDFTKSFSICIWCSFLYTVVFNTSIVPNTQHIFTSAPEALNREGHGDQLPLNRNLIILKTVSHFMEAFNLIPKCSSLWATKRNEVGGHNWSGRRREINRGKNKGGTVEGWIKEFFC